MQSYNNGNNQGYNKRANGYSGGGGGYGGGDYGYQQDERGYGGKGYNREALDHYGDTINTSNGQYTEKT
jgi:hypothetical protein